MADKLGEALGVIASTLLVFVGTAIIAGAFVGIAAGIAVRVFGLF